MDDSWQVPVGSILPSRRSAEEPRLRRRLPLGGGGSSAALGPDDFRDVFGGPPRTLLLRRFSGELRPPPATSLYEEIFRPAAERGGGGAPRRTAGEGGEGGGWERRLPGFRIPERGGMLRTEEGFYDDIFGSDGGGVGGGGGGGGGGEWRTRTRSRSRSKRSSAVSSDEVSPSPAAAAAAPGEDDAVLSFYASKLRPITIPSWRHDASPPSTISYGDQSSVRSFSIPFMNLKDNNNYTAGISSSRLNQQLRPSSVNFRCFSPPETIRRTPWGGNSELDSPPSVISSVSVGPVMPSKSAATEIEKAAVVMEIDCEEDSSNTIPAESSFFIEIDAHGRRKEASEVDEAIAWAKQTFWNQMRKKVEVEKEKENFPDVEG